MIDSPVFPDELEILPAIAAQAGFRSSALLATHADWDHLLGGLAFPDAPLGLGENSAARLMNEPGAAQRELRDFDDEFYVDASEAAVAAGRAEARRAGLHRHRLGDARAASRRRAHRGRHGDLDPVGAGAGRRRLPLAGRDPDALDGRVASSAYLATLNRLEPLVEQADHVVPGHGGPIDAHAGAGDPARGPRLPAGAAAGEDPALPIARRSKAQRAIHAKNLTRR